MAVEPKKMSITPNGELARLLDEAELHPILLERNGRTFRLEADPVSTKWPAPDPERVKQGLERTAGTWAGLDIDAEIAKVYAVREAGSRPASRP